MNTQSPSDRPHVLQIGSLLPALIDQPGNDATAARVASAAASALMKWEPRLSLVRVTLQRGRDVEGNTIAGQAIVNINATVADLGASTRPIAMAVELGAA